MAHAAAVCRAVSYCGQDVVGKNPIRGVAGFGSTVNVAMADLVIEMERYRRNWEQFAERISRRS